MPKTVMPTKCRLLAGSKILIVFLSDTGVKTLFKILGGLVDMTKQKQERETRGWVKRGSDRATIRRKMKEPTIFPIDRVAAQGAGRHETLGWEEANRKTFNEDARTFKHTDAPEVVQHFVANGAFTKNSQPTGNATHVSAGRRLKCAFSEITLVERGDFRTTGINHSPETIV
jgi:hypothetical protein